MEKQQQEQLIHLQTILTMGKYHYSYCIMSMLVGRVFTILDNQNRLSKIQFFEALKAIRQRKLSRPLCELVRFRLSRIMKITKTHQTKNLACGFAMIYERSKLDPEKVKVAKDRAARRKKTEAENAALKSKLTRLMEQLSYLATNIQQTFDDQTGHL